MAEDQQTTTRYYYDDQRVVLRTSVNSSGVESDNRSFVFGNYIDEVLIMRNGATTYYCAHDHLYSPAALFSSSGAVLERYEYDAYGKAAILSANYEPRTMSLYANAYYFTGRELDVLDNGSLEIMYYRARYYDPQTGRFMQRNPLGIDPADTMENSFSAGEQYSDGMNIYEYAASSPVAFVDPFGLWSKTATYEKTLKRVDYVGGDGLYGPHRIEVLADVKVSFPYGCVGDKEDQFWGGLVTVESYNKRGTIDNINLYVITVSSNAAGQNTSLGEKCPPDRPYGTIGLLTTWVIQTEEVRISLKYKKLGKSWVVDKDVYYYKIADLTVDCCRKCP